MVFALLYLFVAVAAGTANFAVNPRKRPGWQDFVIGAGWPFFLLFALFCKVFE